MAVRIQFRRGTTGEWNDVNPVLELGEVGFNTTERRFKLGNGNDQWSNLPYYAVGTITEVIAGNGLVGGGNDGSVTVSLASNVLTTDYVSAKGDLITATADNAPTLLPVGSTNGDVLQVTSSAPTGLSYGKVQSSAIATDAVVESKIQDGSVTAGKIATNAVTSTKIQVSAVTGDKIAPGSVEEDKIANSAVTSSKIANNAVGTNQIADLAVTAVKFADNSVTSAKIANNTIINEDINEFANIGLNKLATGALPTTITVTTGNYVNNSVTTGKLNNTVGPDGVGVWQTWTPTVTGITGAQWTSVYCKYMLINKYCTVQLIIKLVGLSEDSNRNIKFSLPATPAFVNTLPSGAGVAMGALLHYNTDTPNNSSVYTAVYRNGLIEHWFEDSVNGLNISEPDDIISFTTTYEVA